MCVCIISSPLAVGSGDACLAEGGHENGALLHNTSIFYWSIEYFVRYLLVLRVKEQFAHAPEDV